MGYLFASLCLILILLFVAFLFNRKTSAPKSGKDDHYSHGTTYQEPQDEGATLPERRASDGSDKRK